MLKLALAVPVLLAMGTSSGPMTVEGAAPVTIGKQGTAYPTRCVAPLKVTVSGPASLLVDVRGPKEAMSRPIEVDFTRNTKAVSKNALTLKKSKEAGKGFAGLAQVVVAVPDGVQQYVVACDAKSDIALSFRLSKKAFKTNAASLEVNVP